MTRYLPLGLFTIACGGSPFESATFHHDEPSLDGRALPADGGVGGAGGALDPDSGTMPAGGSGGLLMGTGGREMGTGGKDEAGGAASGGRAAGGHPGSGGEASGGASSGGVGSGGDLGTGGDASGGAGAGGTPADAGPCECNTRDGKCGALFGGLLCVPRGVCTESPSALCSSGKVTVCPDAPAPSGCTSGMSFGSTYYCCP